MFTRQTESFFIPTFWGYTFTNQSDNVLLMRRQAFFVSLNGRGCGEGERGREVGSSKYISYVDLTKILIIANWAGKIYGRSRYVPN